VNIKFSASENSSSYYFMRLTKMGLCKLVWNRPRSVQYSIFDNFSRVLSKRELARNHPEIVKQVQK